MEKTLNALDSLICEGKFNDALLLVARRKALLSEENIHYYSAIAHLKLSQDAKALNYAQRLAIMCPLQQEVL